MKRTLFIFAIMIASLSAACVRKENDPQADARKELVDSNHQEYLKRQLQSELVAATTSNGVYRVCIDDVSYLTYSDTIIRQDDRDGKPVKCEIKDGK